MKQFFIRKSGLIPRSSAAAEITHHLQKFGIKPDGINKFLIERASAKQSGAKDTAGLAPRRLITIIAVLGAALVIAGCDMLLGPSERAKTGSLVIGFGTEVRAALSPEVLQSLSYNLVLTGPGNQKIEAKVSSGGTFNQEVALGKWRIDAEARNPGGDLVGTGNATVTVQTGTNQARVPMKTVSPADPIATPAQYREMALATSDALNPVTITGNIAYGIGAFHLGRTVTLSPFAIAKYETTYELWYEVKSWAESHDYVFANPGREGNDGTAGAAPTAAKLEPVTTINWRDAVVWCNAYSEMSGKEPVYYTDANYGTALRTSTNDSGTATAADRAVMKPGANGYRLPTEAEWEYAARGGGEPTSGSFVYEYAGSNIANDVAWYNDNANDVSHPVGGKAANTLGLYDMSGNVYEWCWDWYGSIGVGTVTDPAGPPSGLLRMIRGGSWVHGASLSAVASRLGFYPPTAGLHDYGFRVVCPADSAPGATVVTGVSLDKTTLSLSAGEMETLTATVAPANAANKSVTWVSDNDLVATVSTAGLVTAVAAGTTTITVTTADGGKTASCAVTVVDSASSAQYREMVLATPDASNNVTITGSTAYKYASNSSAANSGVFIKDRTVILSPFKIAKYETTYELWYEVKRWGVNAARGANKYTFPYDDSEGCEGKDGNRGAAPTAAARLEPVTGVTWRDAIVWCNAYSEMSGKEPVYYTDTTYSTVLRVSLYDPTRLDTAADKAVMKPGANGYRLPTEAEWEYAARGGKTPSTSGSFAYKYAGTSTQSELKNYAWYSGNSGNDTHPVGGKTANTLGLHDMTGNVYEWCWDWYGSPVGTGTVTDPVGAAPATHRVYRGGCFFSSGDSLCAVATRRDKLPYNEGSEVGFRVVCR